MRESHPRPPSREVAEAVPQALTPHENSSHAPESKAGVPMGQRNGRSPSRDSLDLRIVMEEVLPCIAAKIADLAPNANGRKRKLESRATRHRTGWADPDRNQCVALAISPFSHANLRMPIRTCR